MIAGGTSPEDGILSSAIRPTVPKRLPIPEPARHFVRQWKSELMGEHAYLTSMMRFVGKHVAQHFHANGPGRGPAVSSKGLDVAAECLGEHLPTTSGALG